MRRAARLLQRLADDKLVGPILVRGNPEGISPSVCLLTQTQSLERLLYAFAIKDGVLLRPDRDVPLHLVVGG